MAGVNRICLIGNVGRECETRYTKGGKAVCSFSLAVTERKGQDVEWFNIVAWDKLAEICQEFLKKGSQVYVEGRQKTETWEKEGVKHYKQNIVIHNMTMLGSVSNNSGSQESACSQGGPDDFEDDDIPF